VKLDREQYLKADAEGRAKVLAKSYGLSAGQMWKHKQSGKWIISHAGVQSIAAQEGVLVEYAVISAAADHAVLMAQIKGGQATFGEANPGNCQMKYYVAMAEKRAFDRCVLIHILREVGGYGQDFYGEDEADDFKQGKLPEDIAAAAQGLGMEAKEKHPDTHPKDKCLDLIEKAADMGFVNAMYKNHATRAKDEGWHDELVNLCGVRKKEMS